MASPGWRILSLVPHLAVFPHISVGWLNADGSDYYQKKFDKNQDIVLSCNRTKYELSTCQQNTNQVKVFNVILIFPHIGGLLTKQFFTVLCIFQRNQIKIGLEMQYWRGPSLNQNHWLLDSPNCMFWHRWFDITLETIDMGNFRGTISRYCKPCVFLKDKSKSLFPPSRLSVQS